ncbi:MAG: MotA/TolQ/ExbB proton channel family protein [Merismopedia sp. SIO2A8]|nr:MotA/TolQ/ExbB proton channel family protein [Merismopedia sp. SIO2A8]
MNIVEVLEKGGPSIWLLVSLFVLLSFLALTTIIERIWFWSKILTREREIVARVLESARREWDAAREISRRSLDQPIGRFLYAALELQSPDPEIFQLALQASADEELAAMRRGEKILEAVIAIAPLLGLLGTVLGLIRSLGSIRLGDLGTTSTEGVTLGISDALGSTAAGLIIAILSLAFYRIFQGLVLGQVKVFRQSGNELELLYRKDWAHRQKMSGGPLPYYQSTPGQSVPMQPFSGPSVPSPSVPSPSVPSPPVPGPSVPSPSVPGDRQLPRQGTTPSPSLPTPTPAQQTTNDLPNPTPWSASQAPTPPGTESSARSDTNPHPEEKTVLEEPPSVNGTSTDGTTESPSLSSSDTGDTGNTGAEEKEGANQ